MNIQQKKCETCLFLHEKVWRKLRTYPRKGLLECEYKCPDCGRQETIRLGEVATYFGRTNNIRTASRLRLLEEALKGGFGREIEKEAKNVIRKIILKK